MKLDHAAEWDENAHERALAAAKKEAERAWVKAFAETYTRIYGDLVSPTGPWPFWPWLAAVEWAEQEALRLLKCKE